MANFIHPANCASLGSYLVKNFASPEIIEVKIGNRQTDKSAAVVERSNSSCFRIFNDLDLTKFQAKDFDAIQD